MDRMNSEMSKLSINPNNITFKPKKKEKEKMEEEGKEEVTKKMKKMRIIDEDEL